MLIRTAVVSSVIALDLMLLATSAYASPATPKHLAEVERQTDLQRIAAQRQRVRRLTTTATGGGEPCGVWRCTWPTSGGGCLVWEKTKCKVINPFD